MAEVVNVNEFEEIARRALPKAYYDFFSGGAEDKYTLKENVDAFRRMTIRPRVLVDVSRINVSTRILGFNVSSPLMLAPTAMHQLAHPEGEVATARAAAASKVIMVPIVDIFGMSPYEPFMNTNAIRYQVLSCMSTCTMEEVASSCDAVRFFQIYVSKRRDITALLVQRAERCGYKAIVLTVDVPKLGRIEADIKNKMAVPQLRNFEGLLSMKATPDEESSAKAFVDETLDASLNWKDISWLRSITNLPILVKGILTAEDAIKAVEVGMAGIIVSNHGARQLDYSPATISVLQEIIRAVRGAAPVFMDGGVRRGTDIFKALALGAQAVLIGRPVIYGLAARGEGGVRKVIEMLKDELELTMALSGCPTIEDITRPHVTTEHDRLHSKI